MNSLGFFGFAYYVENKSRLKIVPIDAGGGPVVPSEATINDGTYQPLSRPIFIYVSAASAKRPEVKEFVKFYLQNAAQLSAEVGYVALPEDAYQHGMKRFETLKTGSSFAGKDTKGKTIVDVMREGA